MNRERLRFIFGFLVVFGGVLFLTRPEPNTLQTIFRLAMIGTGDDRAGRDADAWTMIFERYLPRAYLTPLDLPHPRLPNP